MPEQVTKWKDASGAVHDTFEDAIVGEIACLIGKVGGSTASLAPAIARQIVQTADQIVGQLESLRDYWKDHDISTDERRKRVGLPELDKAGKAPSHDDRLCNSLPEDPNTTAPSVSPGELLHEVA